MRQPASETSSLRIDQWLWFARIAKSRTLAQALIERGKVRINRVRIDKPSQQVKPGDVITISLGPRIRVLQVSALSDRRGPASEAVQLYVELTPDAGTPTRSGTAAESRGGAERAQTSAPEPTSAPIAVRPHGAGRPTKRDRRAIDRLKKGGDG
ncbi:MAG: RNA-binding S4 domain-containing protein [Hyphomicrobium sp.]